MAPTDLREVPAVAVMAASMPRPAASVHAQTFGSAGTPPATGGATGVRELSANDRSRLPHLVTIAWLIVLAAVTFAHPSATRMHTWPWALIVTLLWLAPIVALFLGTFAKSSWRLPPPILTCGLVVFVVSVIAAAISSPFAPASLPRIWPSLGGTALIFVLYHAWSVSLPRRIGLFFAGAGTLFILFAFAGWWGGTWPLPWGVRNDIPFGHSTYTAGAVVLFLPWIALEIHHARGLARAGWAASASLGLLVVASTSSRGSALALAVVATTASLAFVVFGRWSRLRKLALLAGLAAVVSLLIATNPRLRDLVVHRRWSASAEESNVQRRAMIEAGLRLGAARPLLGWGPGTVPLAYPRVRAQLDGGVDNVLQLHSTPAQLWATTGAAGMAGAGLILLGVSMIAFHARRQPTVRAAIASLGGYGLVSLTDHQLDLPVFAAVVAANVALLSAAGADRREHSPASARRRTLTLAALAVIVAVAVPATLRDLRARHAYENALVALEQGDQRSFRAALDRATALAPHDPHFDHQHAGHLIVARFTLRDPAERAALATRAAKLLERSLATGVHQEFAHFNLGWLYLEQSRPSDAVRHFTAAARLVPDKGGVYFGLGLAWLESGRVDSAVRAFALEWINDPRSITSAAWEVPALAPHLPAIHAEMVRLFDGLRALHPRAAVTENWIRWWRGDSPAGLAALRAHNGATARFLAAQSAIHARQELGGELAGAAWARAYAAWRTGSDAGGFRSAAGGDEAFATALARRARTHRDDFRAFLSAPTGDEPALVRSYRRQRPGYGVLALHPEGEPLMDGYIVQENRVTAEFASDLFPAKGWLPGRFLLALLPEPPR